MSRPQSDSGAAVSVSGGEVSTNAIALSGESVGCSACFSVLACDELLRNIFSFFTVPMADDPDEGRHTLMNLAAVCKAVSPLAICMLWEKLDGIAPLAALCTSDSPSTHPSLSRLYRHSRHVRAIELDSGTIPSLILAEPLYPPLPELRRLHWVVPSGAAIQPFVAFIVPSLVELNVNAVSDGNTGRDGDFMASLIDVLHKVASTCPALELLELAWIHGPFLPASSSVAQALSSLRHLEALSITTNLMVSPTALKSLSRIPSLRSLEINHFSEAYDDTIEAGLEAVHTGFDSLRTLSLNGPFSLVHGILTCMPVCSVQRVVVSLQGNSLEPHQKTIVEDIAHKLKPTVNAVSLSFPGDAYVWDSASSAPLSITVLPILRTLDLVDVRLAWVESQQISDELCRDMANSWRHLRVLHLRPLQIIRDPPPSMVTLRGLRHLAEKCPNLSELIIQVNASGGHWADDAGSIRVERTTKSMSLDLTTSLVTHPEAVAPYLTRCFESISSLSFNRVEARMCLQGDRTQAWDRLCALLSIPSE